MRVIFLHDVERVGHEGDVSVVADGYARNYLIPRGLAVKATKGALQELEQRRSAIEKRDAEKRSGAEALAQDLSLKMIVVKATAGEGERLHGQVTAQQIADAAKQQLDMDIDRRDIEIPEPIRQLGDYLISARLYKDVKAQLPVSVVADRQTKADDDEDRKDRGAPEAETKTQVKAAEEADVAEEADSPEPEDEAEEAAEEVADEAENDDEE